MLCMSDMSAHACLPIASLPADCDADHRLCRPLPVALSPSSSVPSPSPHRLLLSTDDCGTRAAPPSPPKEAPRLPPHPPTPPHPPPLAPPSVDDSALGSPCIDSTFGAAEGVQRYEQCEPWCEGVVEAASTLAASPLGGGSSVLAANCERCECRACGGCAPLAPPPALPPTPPGWISVEHTHLDVLVTLYACGGSNLSQPRCSLPSASCVLPAHHSAGHSLQSLTFAQSLRLPLDARHSPSLLSS